MTDQHDVTAMFDAIAPRYDFLNHLLSLRLDRIWRRKTSKKVAEFHPTALLDVATGTADLAIQMANDNPQATITGIDLSEKMLETGREKITQKHLETRIQLLSGNAESLPFPSQSFDAVTCAFGVRNFEHLGVGLQEMFRVVKKEGIVAILEFSQPTSSLIKWPYRLYSSLFIPKTGRFLSGHDTAYTYLPHSIKTFSESNILNEAFEKANAIVHETISFCGGIASLYVCVKKTNPFHNKQTAMAVKQL